MQSAVERREAERGRVPFAVPIQLTHDDYEEPFEAECVDLSPGGLALRSACLPDVGMRLFCRFACPPSGQPIQAYAEVVWARLEGGRSGQFGLRFLELDPSAEVLIAQLLHGEGGTSAERAHASLALLQSSQAELLLDGTAVPLHASIVERRGAHVVLEQELPLLQVGRGLQMSSEGRKGRFEICDVALRLSGPTPRLVFRLTAEPAEFETCESHQVVVDARATAGLSPVGDPRMEQPVVISSAIEEALHATVPPPPMPHVQVNGQEPRLREGMHAGMLDAEGLDADRLHDDGSHDEALDAEGLDDDEVPSDGDDAPRGEPAWLVRTLRGAARAQQAAAWALMQGAQALAALAAAIRIAIPVWLGFLGRQFTKTQRWMRPTRRTQGPVRSEGRAPAAGASRRVGASHARRPNVKVPGWVRMAAVGAMAFCGMAFGVYALAPRTQRHEIPLHRSVQVESLSPVSDDSTEDALALDVAGAEVADPAAAPGHAMPTQQGTAQPGEPSAPAPSREAAPAKPVPAKPAPSGPTFGAASVPNAKRFSLRMTHRIRDLKGTADRGGFSIKIPGSLSLDRAGPIGAAHPGVERAMILNRGDHSELIIRFESGRSPAYRVVGDGSTLEVFIAP